MGQPISRCADFLCDLEFRSLVRWVLALSPFTGRRGFLLRKTRRPAPLWPKVCYSMFIKSNSPRGSANSPGARTKGNRPMATIDTTITITITVNRAAGIITVTDPAGIESGRIEILADGPGWTRTSLSGDPVALYYPDRDALIRDTIGNLREATLRPVEISEVTR